MAATSERSLRRSDMPDQPRTEFHASADQTERELLVEDLERRIEELEGLDDADIGKFTRLDWFFCIAGSVVIPAIALWWFAE
jgi:hypothetical protein